jgi:hypothetical protein
LLRHSRLILRNRQQPEAQRQIHRRSTEFQLKSVASRGNGIDAEHDRTPFGVAMAAVGSAPFGIALVA